MWLKVEGKVGESWDTCSTRARNAELWTVPSSTPVYVGRWHSAHAVKVSAVWRTILKELVANGRINWWIAQKRCPFNSFDTAMTVAISSGQEVRGREERRRGGEGEGGEEERRWGGGRRGGEEVRGRKERRRGGEGEGGEEERRWGGGRRGGSIKDLWDKYGTQECYMWRAMCFVIATSTLLH